MPMSCAGKDMTERRSAVRKLKEFKELENGTRRQHINLHMVLVFKVPPKGGSEDCHVVRPMLVPDRRTMMTYFDSNGSDQESIEHPKGIIHLCKSQSVASEGETSRFPIDSLNADGMLRENR
jgi:hypothetical protein